MTGFELRYGRYVSSYGKAVARYTDGGVCNIVQASWFLRPFVFVYFRVFDSCFFRAFFLMFRQRVYIRYLVVAGEVIHQLSN